MKKQSYITFPNQDKKILGLSGLNHDSTITLLNGKDIVFSGHSERYSGVKNDEYLNHDILNDVYRHRMYEFDAITWFEQPIVKKYRQLWAHQYSEVFQRKNLPSHYLKQYHIKPTHYIPHHLSHCSAAYFTSPYRESIGVVIDAIGEWDTASIWYINTENKQTEFRKLWSMKYPNSIGLFYSSVTQRLGLKPQEDEYILMGMAGWGIPNKRVQEELRQLLSRNNHRGCLDWDSKSMPDDNTEQWKFDIAHNTQIICEEEIMKIFKRAKSLVPNVDNFVYGGGVALNCVANSKIVERYPNLWILPNPGDGGSSLGSAAFVLGEHLNWDDTFLGYDIKGDYPYDKVLKELYKGNIVGVANGRAEYGPRALGNRSLLADPRGDDIKDKVNKIKKRQEFRPFAPAVLEEHAHEIFEMPVQKSQYMQFVAPCKYPDLYPAICHIDNTSRVQTVSEEDNPNFYRLIKEFYKKTGCPMLLNTSLNIKGMPIVNTREDGVMFEKKYGIKVF